MTREERALRNLKQMCSDGRYLGSGSYIPLEVLEDFSTAIKALEQEPQTFKWCTDCREYDQEKHCCHRWSKVIRDTVEEIKQEQEPILDKIRAEIAELDNNVCQQFLIEDVDKEVHRAYQDCLNILDKYKTESEG